MTTLPSIFTNRRYYEKPKKLGGIYSISIQKNDSTYTKKYNTIVPAITQRSQLVRSRNERSVSFRNSISSHSLFQQCIQQQTINTQQIQNFKNIYDEVEKQIKKCDTNLKEIHEQIQIIKKEQQHCRQVLQKQNEQIQKEILNSFKILKNQLYQFSRDLTSDIKFHNKQFVTVDNSFKGIKTLYEHSIKQVQKLENQIIINQ